MLPPLLFRPDDDIRNNAVEDVKQFRDSGNEARPSLAGFHIPK